MRSELTGQAANKTCSFYTQSNKFEIKANVPIAGAPGAFPVSLTRVGYGVCNDETCCPRICLWQEKQMETGLSKPRQLEPQSQGGYATSEQVWRMI